jgi:hypothetical protein
MHVGRAISDILQARPQPADEGSGSRPI